MNELLSVIIPFYNNEHYLPQTIESVLNQTYKNLELILVDDGSTDNSLRICQEVASKDSRIQIIKKENGGVSSARNCGLEAARGTYIAFLDGDDCIDADMYKSLIAILKKENVDLVNCRIIKETSFQPIPYQKMNVIVSSQPLDCLLKKEHSIDSSLNKVYTHALIGTTRFDESISYSEDKLFVSELLIKAKRIALTDQCFYHYIQHKDSLSWQDSYPVWEGNFSANQKIYKKISQCTRANEQTKNSVFYDYIKSIIALLRYDIKHRQKKQFNETLNLYQKDLRFFLQTAPLSFAKKIEYQTYIHSYFLASLVHYYFKKKA